MSASAGLAASSAIQVATNAIKACGVLVKLEPEAFAQLLRKTERPLVVMAVGGWFSQAYRYVTPYRGLTFHCKSSTPVELPATVELIDAARISIPDL